jgi:hypothetical protein
MNRLVRKGEYEGLPNVMGFRIELRSSLFHCHHRDWGLPSYQEFQEDIAAHNFSLHCKCWSSNYLDKLKISTELPATQSEP